MVRALGAVPLALVAALTVACAPARAATPGEVRSVRGPTLRAWRGARARLAELRAERALRPRTLKIALELREPHTGRRMEARGAVALAPARDPDRPEVRGALRMILLGPGGTTALDLWLEDERFRFAVPAIDLLRRGDASTPRSSMRGLPVDFLGWWLLAPYEGSLLWYDRTEGAERFVLRSGAAIVELRVLAGGRIEARRSTRAQRNGEPSIDVETVSAGPGACAGARYRQESTGLDVAVTCEGQELERPPSPRAFTDPDAPDPGALDGGS